MCSQLFGEADPDEDVSPDTNDPEVTGKEPGASGTEESATPSDGQAAAAASSAGNGAANDSAKVTTRKWAEQVSFRQSIFS